MEKKNIMTIASIMIVILALLLVVIFINYNQPLENTKSPTILSSGEAKKPQINNELDVSNNNDSGESNIEIITQSGETTSGEIEADDKVEEKEEPIKNEPKKTDFGTLSEASIISSQTETSNQEKQQILNEIDDALQGLLDAVGKVQTVDEAKLDASLESEVEP